MLEILSSDGTHSWGGANVVDVVPAVCLQRRPDSIAARVRRGGDTSASSMRGLQRCSVQSVRCSGVMCV
jgi:hypothetical protein